MADAYLRHDLKAHFSSAEMLDQAFAMKGEVVRAVARRQTLKVEIDGRSFYLKRHRGAGWLEILKNWLVLKKPVLGAENEFVACRHLEQAGILAPRVAAFAAAAGSPASRDSFVLCDALTGYEDLESVTDRWFDDPPDGHEKRRLVERVARFARDFHGAGLVHRDFYLCHLLTPLEHPADLLGHPAGLLERPSDPLAVLDLHRALVFEVVPDKWRKRDLAALLYSTLDLPLNRRAWFRFVRIYRGQPLRQTFAREGEFWREVYRRACDLYRKGARKGLTRGHFEP